MPFVASYVMLCYVRVRAYCISYQLISLLVFRTSTKQATDTTSIISTALNQAGINSVRIFSSWAHDLCLAQQSTTEH